MVYRYLRLINVKAPFHNVRPHKHVQNMVIFGGQKPLCVQMNHIVAEVTDG